MKRVCKNMLKKWVILYHFVEKKYSILKTCRSGAKIPMPGPKRSEDPDAGTEAEAGKLPFNQACPPSGSRLWARARPACPGATSLANFAISILFISPAIQPKHCMPGLGQGCDFHVLCCGIIIFISASCCNKSSKPGLGQGFQFQT